MSKTLQPGSEMTLTVTITCNGITRTAKGTPSEVDELLKWMVNLVLPEVVMDVSDMSNGVLGSRIRSKYGNSLDHFSMFCDHLYAPVGSDNMQARCLKCGIPPIL